MIALDTSVAVPLVLHDHEFHEAVVEWRADRESALAGHAHVETYSVLTRMPKGSRAEPLDVVRAMRSQFAEPLILDAEMSVRIPEVLAELGISGGAVYDALVGLAALQHDCPLATLDRRARDTYQTLGVDVLEIS